MNSTDEEKRFQEVLRKFKNRIEDPLRLEELFSILKLVFYAGLEKKEATDLKIGDVLQGDQADQIFLTPGGNPIQISEEVKSALFEYVWALQPWNMPSNSPLYPRYFGESGRKNLDRYLKPLRIGPIDFKRLRRAGVKHHYKMLRRDVGDSEAKEETGRKFRLTERTIGDILGDKTQPPGEIPPEEQSPSGRSMDIIKQQEGLSTSDILIDDKVPKLVDEYFNVLDEMTGFKSENERTQMKENFLDNIIGQPLSWTADKFYKPKKEVNLKVLKALTESNLTDQIKSMTEEDPKAKKKRRPREGEEHEKERKKYLDNFEDTDNTHTAEQKLDVKKEKLFKFIEGIKGELTREEKKEIVDLEKWSKEQNKPKKQREQPWAIIREEKSMHLPPKISLWPKKPSKRGWVTNASERRRIKREAARRRQLNLPQDEEKRKAAEEHLEKDTGGLPSLFGGSRKGIEKKD